MLFSTTFSPMQELRVAFQRLWKDKSFTLTAALTLTVCIGANTSLFTVVDHVLLRPLRVPESDRVLFVYNSYPNAGAARAGATAPDYFDRLRELSVFEEQAMFNLCDPSLDAGGTPERIHTMQVTPSFFRLTRVPPQVGRIFDEEAGEVGSNTEIILSDGLWRRVFGGRAVRSGPRNLDSGLSEIPIVFQAAVPKLVASKYTTSGVRRPSEL